MKEPVDFSTDRELIGTNLGTAAFDHFDEFVDELIDHLEHGLRLSRRVIWLEAFILKI